MPKQTVLPTAEQGQTREPQAGVGRPAEMAPHASPPVARPPAVPTPQQVKRDYPEDASGWAYVSSPTNGSRPRPPVAPPAQTGVPDGRGSRPGSFTYIGQPRHPWTRPQWQDSAGYSWSNSAWRDADAYVDGAGFQMNFAPGVCNGSGFLVPPGRSMHNFMPRYGHRGPFPHGGNRMHMRQTLIQPVNMFHPHMPQYGAVRAGRMATPTVSASGRPFIYVLRR
jgi:hypothetical protein